MYHTWKTGSHLKIGSDLKKWVTLGKKITIEKN